MKLRDALKTIEAIPAGFIVAFERNIGDDTWAHDRFPELSAGETALPTLAKARELARKFARRSKPWVRNVRVVRVEDNAVVWKLR